MDKFDRVRLLIGAESLNVLKNASVAVFGIGGVGGFAVEALVRSGIGSITIVDSDVVAETNLNRQIIATLDAVGKDKVEVMKERLLSINPDVKVNAKKLFVLPENVDTLDFEDYDYIIDAVDTVSAKLAIIERASLEGVPIISCMGTGGKLDATKLKVADVYKTTGCPLARVMRRELKKRGVQKLKTVYSEELSTLNETELSVAEEKSNGRIAPASMIFVPASAGLLLAREAVFDIIKLKGKKQ